MPRFRPGFPVASTSCPRSEEHTSELQSLTNLVCRLLLEKKNKQHTSRCCLKIAYAGGIFVSSSRARSSRAQKIAYSPHIHAQARITPWRHCRRGGRRKIQGRNEGTYVYFQLPRQF